jgi:hypothetical protein
MAKMQPKPYDPEMTEAIERLKNKQSEKQTSKVVPTGAFTCRINLETVAALRIAATDRKVKGQTPASQQEIVQAALDNWLRDNGYL